MSEDIKIDIVNDNNIISNQVSNQEYLNRWETDLVLTKRSAGTIKNYLSQMSQFSKFIKKSFIEVTRYDVKCFISGNLKAATQQTKQQIIYSFYQWMIDEGHYMKKEQHPLADGCIEIKKEKRLPQDLSKKQIEEINLFLNKQVKEAEQSWRFGKIRVIDGIRQKERIRYEYDIYNTHRDRLAFNLMIATGIRSTELLTLKLEYFDLNNDSIRFIGKGDKERMIYYKPKYSTMIKKFIERFGIVNGYLFKGKNEGSHWSKSGLDYLFKKIENETGISIHPHMTRHTYGVHFMNTPDENGKYADLSTLQEILGHTNIRTTQIYTCVGGEKMKKEVGKFAPNF